MLIDIALHQPQLLGSIVRHTPAWVWGLLAGLLVLGASQLRDRTASLLRVSVMPFAMTAFAAWGNASAFGRSPSAGLVFTAWFLAAAAVALVVARTPVEARYDPARREYFLPGSAVPLLLIAAVFMVKWAVGVELAMQPGLAGDRGFALGVAALYGVFNGVFIGRALRLWKLTLRAPDPATAS